MTQPLIKICTKASNWPGIIGMLLIVWGTLLPPSLMQKWLFLIGAIGLLLTAICERQRLLIALEIVVIWGTLLALLPFSLLITVLALAGVTVMVIAWLLWQGELKTVTSMLGGTGLLLLALGYAVLHPLIYLSGGVVLCFYSARLILEGVEVAWLWGLMNAIFVFATIYSFF